MGPRCEGVVRGILWEERVPEGPRLHITLGLSKVGACSTCLCRSPNCCLQRLGVAAGDVCSWPCLSWGSMKGRSNIARGILGDMAVPSQLSTKLLELGVCLRKLAAKGLEKVEEVLGLNATCSQEL